MLVRSSEALQVLNLHPPMNLARNINLKGYSNILRDGKKDHLKKGRLFYFLFF